MLIKFPTTTVKYTLKTLVKNPVPFFLKTRLTYVNQIKETTMVYYWIIIVLSVIIMLITGCTPY